MQDPKLMDQSIIELNCYPSTKLVIGSLPIKPDDCSLVNNYFHIPPLSSGRPAAAAWSSWWRIRRRCSSSGRGPGWAQCRGGGSRHSAPYSRPRETEADPAAAGPLAPRAQVPAQGAGQRGSAAVQPAPLPHHEERAQPHDSLPGWQVLPG